MATLDRAHIERCVADTRDESRRCLSTDPTYAELMGTYTELGILLATEDDYEEFTDDCGVLVDRLIYLGRRMDTEMAQAQAARFAKQLVERGT